MLRGLIDYSSSLSGAGVIFRKGLRLQQADLLGHPSPSSSAALPRYEQQHGSLPAAQASSASSSTSSPFLPPSTSGFVLDLRPTAAYRASKGLPPLGGEAHRPPQPSVTVTVQPSPPPQPAPVTPTPVLVTPTPIPPIPTPAPEPIRIAIPQEPIPSPTPAEVVIPAAVNPPPPAAEPISVEALSEELKGERESVKPVEKVPVDDGASVEGWVEQQDNMNDVPVTLKPSRIPSSRIGRLFHYGSLATSLSFGAASEAFRRSTSGSDSTGSLLLSESNINRLVEKLGQMRGAALKLGQFMSIQDSGSLPPELEKVLSRVQAGADYMPDWQMTKAMSAELGPEWRSRFESFSAVPIASASIGQVHSGSVTLPSGSSLPVAVKIQFPGVSTSISSDISNLSLLLRSAFLLPKGLYLENTLKVMRGELEQECDYIREAECARKFGRLLGVGEPGEEGNLGGAFRVPRIVDELSTEKVLTMEMMEGKPLSRVTGLNQTLRNEIGSNIMRLCLRELFEFRIMQTDPNWSNFLFNARTRQIEVIDFGATQEYSKVFMDDWFRLLSAAIGGDKVEMEAASLRLKYLTGEENPEMLEAHLESMSLVASPFRRSSSPPGQPFNFYNQTITTEVKALIPVMLRHRLTPPPRETYSLNRKLSGAYLLCARLGSQVDCAGMWEEIAAQYKLDQ